MLGLAASLEVMSITKDDTRSIWALFVNIYGHASSLRITGSTNECVGRSGKQLEITHESTTVSVSAAAWAPDLPIETRLKLPRRAG